MSAEKSMYRTAFAAWLLLSIVGCSSQGLSLTPTGHHLTDQAEAVLDQAPRQVFLPRELNKNVLAAHYLQPGDVLLVEPVELDAAVRLPADQKVLADGTIDLGGVGRVIVAGLTLEAAEELIEQTIVDAGEDATAVNVRLLEPVHRYYVLGEVASPGIYPLTGNETVLDGILAAGGLTSQANPCKVLLARPTPPPSCRVALPICYREITQLGDTTTNYQLQPGDRIFVASRTFHEELKFWRANETCERCCGCQFPCPDPSVANYTNPISSILPAAPTISSTTEVEPREPNTAGGRLGEPGFVEDSEEPLPLPEFRRMPPPTGANQTPPASHAPGELQFDRPLPGPNDRSGR